MTTKIADAESYLRRRLADGPQLAISIAKGTTIHARTLRRAAFRLGVIRSRRGESGAWVWALPKEDRLFAPSHRWRD